MSASDIVKELEAMPRPERATLAKRVLESLGAHGKLVERIMRRIENPDVPEEVWRGIEEAEDGQLIDLDEALTELEQP